VAISSTVTIERQKERSAESLGAIMIFVVIIGFLLAVVFFQKVNPPPIVEKLDGDIVKVEVQHGCVNTARG
jgi:hypothetical protein